MFFIKDQKAVIFFIAVFTASSVAGFIWGNHLTSSSERKPLTVFGSQAGNANPVVSTDTILYREKLYFCGDLEKISEEKAPGSMIGLDRKGIIERFPASDGWIVNFHDPQSLTLTIKCGELCPVHRDYRHLGIYQGKVAVYEGPIEFHGKVIRVENITLESLESGLRTRLEQVMSLGTQTSAITEKLREEFEFTSDEVLNSVLENFDENS